MGERASKGVLADDWVERKDPEYEKAEEVWANGQHLDAIALMREYLAKNPREQHVAIRIAEIYEKDLGNPLAAALELEEVLRKKLPREKWGWTAVRLSNLYSGRLNQSDKALQLLERIVNEYPETGAAKKARQRLGLPEPEVAVQPAAEEAPEEDSDDSPPPPPEPPSGLPKGFRKRS
jgi:tetratricopeptide (TPR) repeat protein